MIIQSYQNFEAIVVNDGSTDSTQDIIDEYCAKYSNFKSVYQENKGLAGARNTGIKIAKGDFIGFLDGDDEYPLDTLKHYNESINSSIAIPDIVIGQQILIDPWQRYSYVNAERFSNEDVVDPMDKGMIWTMSVCNKMFSRKKINENNSLFPPVSYAEDGAFLLPLIYSSDLIIGCPHEVLFYKKRAFDNYSISQTASMKSLNDYLHVHELIHESFLEFTSKKRDELKFKNSGEFLDFKIKYLNYLDNLLYRQSSILVSQFYSFFWRTDKEVIKKVLDLIYKYKTEMVPKSWEKLKNKFKELDLENLHHDDDLIAENPYVTIAIAIEDINKDDFNRLINNLYNSFLPNFEIFIPNSKSNCLSDDFVNRKNFHVISDESDEIKVSIKADFKNNVLSESKGKYLLFIDEDIFVSPNFLKYTYNALRDSQYDFLTLRMFPLVNTDLSEENDFETFKFSPQELIFAKNGDYDKYDYYFCNKLIKKEFLDRINFKFTKNQEKDVKRLYGKGKFKKLRKKHILALSDNIKNPLITIAIDKMDKIDINKKDFNELIESIYTQSFKSFEIIINKKLSGLLEEEFLANKNKNKNIKFIDDDNFKNDSIEKSGGKYILFADAPVLFAKNTLKTLFDNIDENNSYAFVSAYIFRMKQVNKRKKLYHFSSQELSYSKKSLKSNKSVSRFDAFDFYLANKLIRKDYFKENNVSFDGENSYDVVLDMYRSSEFSKVDEKLIMTKLDQNKLFYSVSSLPMRVKLLYKIHKIIFSFVVFRRSLKAFFNLMKHGGR